MKKLYLEPRGGLCNRLLAVISCLRLCALFERELLLVWEPTTSCCSHWGDLFLNPIPTVPAKPGKTAACRHFIIDARHLRSKAAKPYLDLAAIEEDIVVSSNVLLSFPGDPIRGESFWTFEPIIGACSPWLNALRPIPLISEKAAAVSSRFIAGKTVGIHLRRGFHDKDGARRNFRRVSDADFARVTETIPMPEREMHFVASDIQGSIDYFIRRYADSACFYPKRSNAKWNKPEAIQDALVDLLCLAACDRIVGHHNSTFSLVAVMFRLLPYYEVWPLGRKELRLKRHTFSVTEGSYRHDAVEKRIRR